MRLAHSERSAATSRSPMASSNTATHQACRSRPGLSLRLERSAHSCIRRGSGSRGWLGSPDFSRRGMRSSLGVGWVGDLHNYPPVRTVLNQPTAQRRRPVIADRVCDERRRKCLNALMSTYVNQFSAGPCLCASPRDRFCHSESHTAGRASDRTAARSAFQVRSSCGNDL